MTDTIERDAKFGEGKLVKLGSAVAMNERTGGIAFKTMAEVVEGAQLMARSGAAVPEWLRNNPGGCWAVILQASQWEMDPISVARMSYEVVSQGGVRNVAYMSQLIHALIEKRAPISQRLRIQYTGENQNRQCIITGQIKGETEPLVYTSPPLAKISPKKSPLWSTDPDQQLAYYSIRAWSRRYCPDVILGVYDRDEAEEFGAQQAKDITAASEALEARLSAAREREQAAGIQPEGVNPANEQNAVGASQTPKNDHPATVTHSGPENAPLSAAASQNRGKKGKKKGKTAESPESPKTLSGEVIDPPRATTLTSPERMPTADVIKRIADDAERATDAEREHPRPLMPTDPGTYLEYVKDWLRVCKTEEQIEARWKADMKLRLICNIDKEARLEIRAMIDSCIAGLRT